MVYFDGTPLPHFRYINRTNIAVTWLFMSAHNHNDSPHTPHTPHMSHMKLFDAFLFDGMSSFVLPRRKVVMVVEWWWWAAGGGDGYCRSGSRGECGA
jgi:hypothetical protein